MAVVSPAAGSFEFAGVAASEAGAGGFPFFDGDAGDAFTLPDETGGFRAPADAFTGALVFGAVELVLPGAAVLAPAVVGWVLPACVAGGAVAAGALGRGGGAAWGWSFLFPAAKSVAVVEAGASGCSGLNQTRTTSLSVSMLANGVALTWARGWTASRWTSETRPTG